MGLAFFTFLVAVFGVGFVVTALSEKRTLAARAAHAVVAALLTLALGLWFAALGFERGPTGGRMVMERGLTTVEVEVASRWALRAFGAWLVVLAGGELLRLILKRAAGTEVLAPAVLFLAGTLLIDPQWGIGAALAVALACLTAVSVWGRPGAPQAPPPRTGPANAPEGAPSSPAPIVVDRTP